MSTGCVAWPHRCMYRLSMICTVSNSKMLLRWVGTFQMLRCRWAPLPAVDALSFGRKLAVSPCFAATPQMASLVNSRPSVACSADPLSSSLPDQ